MAMGVSRSTAGKDFANLAWSGHQKALPTPVGCDRHSCLGAGSLGANRSPSRAGVGRFGATLNLDGMHDGYKETLEQWLFGWALAEVLLFPWFSD